MESENLHHRCPPHHVHKRDNPCSFIVAWRKRQVLLGPNLLGPNLLGPSLLRPSLLGPSLLGLSLLGPSLLRPSLLGPSLLGPSLLGPNLLGPSLLGPSLLGPSLLGPSLLGPSLLGPSLLGPSLKSRATKWERLGWGWRTMWRTFTALVLEVFFQIKSWNYPSWRTWIILKRSLQRLSSRSLRGLSRDSDLPPWRNV